MDALIAQTTSALGQSFVQNALIAGTAVALAAGLTGYFLVLRGQVFSADALGHVAFTGAAVALAAGIDPRIGLFAAAVAVGVLLGLLGKRGTADDVVIGNVLAWVLGLGVFFLSLYVTTRSSADNAAGTTVLFGSVFGLTQERALTAAFIAIGASVALLAIARPLLFATIDEPVARSLGVPVRALGVGFLALCGVVTAEAAQAVGVLLLLGLLAAPAGTAMRLTTRPYTALALSAGIAVADLWAGLLLSLAVPVLPPSFSIVAVAAAVYGIATAATARRAS